MEFAKRTYYRISDTGYSRSISIETVDNGNFVRLTISQDRYPMQNCNAAEVSIDLPENIACAIRDHLNNYLSK